MDEKTIHNQFGPLREIALTEQEKRIIRQRFKDQQTKSLQIQKLFRVMRYTGYTAVGIFGVFVLVGSFLPQNQFVDTSNPLFTLLSPSGQSVQADTLGRFVKVEGIVNISEQGTILPNTEIRAGQTVVLQQGASRVVQIMGTTFATITGPATFMLEKLPGSNETVLNLLEGSIVEVTNQITPADLVQNNDTQGEAKQLATNTVVIKTKLVQVRTETDQSSSFVISQTDESADVVASVGTVTVKQFIRDSDTQELLVQAGDSAHINTAGIALNVPESEQEVTKLAAASKELQIRYQKETEKEQKNELPEEVLIALATTQDDESIEAGTASDETMQALSARVATTSVNVTDEKDTALPSSLRKQLINAGTFGLINEQALPGVFAQINQTYILLDLPAPGVSDIPSAIAALRALPSHEGIHYTLPATLYTTRKKGIQALHTRQTESVPHQENNVAKEENPLFSGESTDDTIPQEIPTNTDTAPTPEE